MHDVDVLSAERGQVGEPRREVRHPLLREELRERPADDRDDDPVRSATMDDAGRRRGEVRAVPRPHARNEPEIGMEQLVLHPSDVRGTGETAFARRERVAPCGKPLPHERAPEHGLPGDLREHLDHRDDDQEEQQGEDDTLPAR